MTRQSLTLLIFAMILSFSCSDDDSSDITSEEVEETEDNQEITDESASVYSGTASVTQGAAITTMENLYSDGQRVAGLGSITSLDNQTWVVPAEVNYTDSSFPFAPSLSDYNSSAEALANFQESDIVVVDNDGELITGYIFADNYFELYINGTPVGKDDIPFTPFNSHIVRFQVTRPFTIAMLLVDWEENLGLGSEENRGNAYHPGDGGMVATFKTSNDEIIATTGADWKAQTFYTAPIKDLTCPSEDGTTRSTSACDTEGENDGTSFYGLHWPVPADWNLEGFDDSEWPYATTYTNETIGVDNKSSYTDFTDIFDDTSDDAAFIWSTNVILDNEVIVRYTVE